MVPRFVPASLIGALLIGSWLGGSDAIAAEGRAKRTISYQSKDDLFYNYYVGQNPCGAEAAMYVSPRPVPANVGHTYITYQPLMPHEYMYKHTRSHYAHTDGAGWSRSKTRYRSRGLRFQHVLHNLNFHH